MPWTFSYRKKGWVQYLPAENAAINQTILLAISQGDAIHAVRFHHLWHGGQTVYELDLKGMTQENRDNQTIRAIQAHRPVGERWEDFDWKRDVELAATLALHPPPAGDQPSPGERPGEGGERVERLALSMVGRTGVWIEEGWSEYQASGADTMQWTRWKEATAPQPLPRPAAEEQSPQDTQAISQEGDQQSQEDVEEAKDEERPGACSRLHPGYKPQDDTALVAVGAVLHRMSKVVSLNCSCTTEIHRPLLWLPDEDRPRCFECVKPIWQTSRLSVSEKRHLLVYMIYT